VNALLPTGDEPVEGKSLPVTALAEESLSTGSPVAEPVLQVELDATGPSCRLTLNGVLCDTSLTALEAQVDQLGCLPCELVVVDVQRLSRLDSAGAKVLLGLYHYVIARGGDLWLSGARDQVITSLLAVGGDVIPTVEGLD
jgi:anti-anti-sigma regulatory factor